MHDDSWLANLTFRLSPVTTDHPSPRSAGLILYSWSSSKLKDRNHAENTELGRSKSSSCASVWLSMTDIQSPNLKPTKSLPQTFTHRKDPYELSGINEPFKYKGILRIQRQLIRAETLMTTKSNINKKNQHLFPTSNTRNNTVTEQQHRPAQAAAGKKKRPFPLPSCSRTLYPRRSEILHSLVSSQNWRF